MWLIESILARLGLSNIEGDAANALYGLMSLTPLTSDMCSWLSDSVWVCCLDLLSAAGSAGWILPTPG